MEVDTGAAVSLMSEAMWHHLFPTVVLENLNMRLHTYTAQPITVVGQCTVKVKYQTYAGEHTLTVVTGDGPALTGRDWLQHMRLDWANIYVMSVKAPTSCLILSLSGGNRNYDSYPSFPAVQRGGHPPNFGAPIQSNLPSRMQLSGSWTAWSWKECYKRWTTVSGLLLS